MLHKGKQGEENPPPGIREIEVIQMYTISDILTDINRGCLANNMIDCSYRDLRKSLENIIRGKLTLTNNIVIAETTVIKNGKCTCLQSRSYSFSLEEYFRRVKGECNNRNNQYCRNAG